MASPDDILPHETFGYALKRAQHALRLRMDAELRQIGLTAPQYAVLASLEVEPGASNATLARRAFVTPQTMQAMLVTLERDGMIDRTPDAAHRRIQRTLLTRAGAAALTQAHAVAHSAERRVIDAIGAGDAGRVTALLHLVADRMR